MTEYLVKWQRSDNLLETTWEPENKVKSLKKKMKFDSKLKRKDNFVQFTDDSGTSYFVSN